MNFLHTCGLDDLSKRLLSRSGLTVYENHILHTCRLSLSVPTDADNDAISTIHSDARTYDPRPELATKSREEAVELARAWQKNWREKQLDYYVVSELDDTTIGFTGVCHSEEADEEVLNLYYRCTPESQGEKACQGGRSCCDCQCTRTVRIAPRRRHHRRPNAASIALTLKLGLH